MPMTDAERDAFLARTRLGIFVQAREDGPPVAVPVWFEWDGAVVRIFSGKTSGKLRRLRRDPRASLLVHNDVGEPEAWVAFDGAVTVRDDGAAAFALAERLAVRYWDVTDAAKAAELASWRNGIVLIEMRPERIRTSAG